MDKIKYHGLAILIALIFSIPYFLMLNWLGIGIFSAMLLFWVLINSNKEEDEHEN